MKKLFLLVLFVFLSFGCDEDKEEKDFIKIGENTKIADETTLQNFVSFEDNGDMIFFASTDYLNNLKSGDVLVFDQSTTASGGLLRKVTSVTSGATQIIVSTEQATLEDAIEEAKFTVEQEVNVQDVEDASMIEGVSLDQTKASVSGEFKITLTEVLHEGIELSGSLSIKPTLRMESEFASFSLKRFLFKVSSENKLTLTASATAKLVEVEKKKKIATFKIKPLTIYIPTPIPPIVVPIVITPRLDVYIGVKGSVELAVSSSASLTTNMDFGFEYKDGEWNNLSDFSQSFDFQPPTVEGKANLRAFLEGEIPFMIYSVVGPKAVLTLFAELNAHISAEVINPDKNCYDWDITAGIEVQAGVKVEALGKTVVDKETDPLITFDTKLAEGGTCGVCGNGKVDGDEVCDGEDVNGFTCTDIFGNSNQLKCNDDCKGYDYISCFTPCEDGWRYCDGNNMMLCENQEWQLEKICPEVCDALDFYEVQCTSCHRNVGATFCTNTSDHVMACTDDGEIYQYRTCLDGCIGSNASESYDDEGHCVPVCGDGYCNGDEDIDIQTYCVEDCFDDNICQNNIEADGPNYSIDCSQDGICSNVEASNLSFYALYDCFGNGICEENEGHIDGTYCKWDCDGNDICEDAENNTRTVDNYSVDCAGDGVCGALEAGGNTFCDATCLESVEFPAEAGPVIVFSWDISSNYYNFYFPDECCGDGICQPVEGGSTETYCVDDCADDGICVFAEVNSADNTYHNSGDCCGDGQCVEIEREVEGYCLADCCGDGECMPSENYNICPYDCPICGDNICGSGESSTCPDDC